MAIFEARIEGHSKGEYDRRQIERDNQKHQLVKSWTDLEHVNLKAVFAKRHQLHKQVGMAQALNMSGLQLEGQHHRALADAQNIAQLLPFVF